MYLLWYQNLSLLRNAVNVVRKVPVFSLDSLLRERDFQVRGLFWIEHTADFTSRGAHNYSQWIQDLKLYKP